MPNPPDRLVLASHNPGKLREIAELLAPFGTAVQSAADLGLPEPEETGRTFTENALIKAHASAAGSGLPALSDDSGLCVVGLGGAPGVRSARWAGPDKDFGRAMDKVEEALGSREERGAYFVCALALAWPDGRAEVFEGRVDGQLVFPSRGTRSFGYDPIFLPDGETLTFGEMERAAKHAMSHRARAFAKLVAAIFAADPT